MPAASLGHGHRAMVTGILFLALFLTARIWAPRLRDHLMIAVLIIMSLTAISLFRDFYWG